MLVNERHRIAVLSQLKFRKEVYRRKIERLSMYQVIWNDWNGMIDCEIVSCGPFRNTLAGLVLLDSEFINVLTILLTISKTFDLEHSNRFPDAKGEEVATHLGLYFSQELVRLNLNDTVRWWKLCCDAMQRISFFWMRVQGTLQYLILTIRPLLHLVS